MELHTSDVQLNPNSAIRARIGKQHGVNARARHGKAKAQDAKARNGGWARGACCFLPAPPFGLNNELLDNNKAVLHSGRDMPCALGRGERKGWSEAGDRARGRT